MTFAGLIYAFIECVLATKHVKFDPAMQDIDSLTDIIEYLRKENKTSLGLEIEITNLHPKLLGAIP